MQNSLVSSGWHLSQEGLSTCQAGCTEKSWPTSDKNIIKIALDSDLRAIAEPTLPRNLGTEVRGPLVLQIQKVKNVAVSSRKQHLPSPGRRLLRLYLTDGGIQFSGVEIDGPLAKLSSTTPPGTKVKLRGTVKVQNGFLLLTKSSLEVLGGEVDHLLKKWNTQKVTPGNLDRSKSGGTDGPPPFTAFRVDGSTRSRRADTSSHKLQPLHGGREKNHDKYSSSGQQQALQTYSRPHHNGSHSKSSVSESGTRGTQQPLNKQQFRDTLPSKQQGMFQKSSDSQGHKDSGTHQKSRGDSRPYEQTSSRDSKPLHSTLQGGRESMKDIGERLKTAGAHKSPYDRKEKQDRGTGRGRGRRRHDEQEFESQRPKKGYDLADFLTDKLQLVATGPSNDQSVDNHSGDRHPSRPLKGYKSKRDGDLAAQEKRRTDTSSDYRHGDDRWRSRPREAWVDDSAQTTMRESGSGTHHTRGGHQMPPKRGPHYKGGQSTVESEQKGHWDWISGGSGGSSVPYSAKKQ